MLVGITWENLVCEHNSMSWELADLQSIYCKEITKGAQTVAGFKGVANSLKEARALTIIKGC